MAQGSFSSDSMHSDLMHDDEGRTKSSFEEESVESWAERTSQIYEEVLLQCLSVLFWKIIGYDFLSLLALQALQEHQKLNVRLFDYPQNPHISSDHLRLH